MKDTKAKVFDKTLKGEVIKAKNNAVIDLQLKDGQVVTGSKEVADRFGKEHSDVMKTIKSLIEGVGKSSDTLFIHTQYQHSQNKQWYPEYLLTRDGFSLLVMGFTGKEALKWKLKYIEAFNKMEQALKEPRRLTPQEELRLHYQVIEEHAKEIESVRGEVTEVREEVTDLKDNMPLFNIECKELQALVRSKGVQVLGGYKSTAYNDHSLRGKVYSDIQRQIKREFGISKYEAIKRSQLDIARSIVEEYKAPTVLVTEISNLNNQMRLD